MGGFLRGLGTAIWRFMVVFSFIVNIVLVIVLIGLGAFIFDIKNEVAGPLIGGLHSTAAGLQQSTIDWTIPVREEVPVNLPNIPINADTIISHVDSINGQPVERIPGETLVTLTRPVPITINNAFINSNDLTLRNATVQITLPEGTRLPVSLDLAIKLEDASLPVNLDVRAVIPLQETQLNDPVTTLGLQFEPLAIALHNLPNSFGEAWDFGGALLGGDRVDDLLGLTAADGSGFNAQAYDPWPGFSQTAGLNYNLFSEAFPPDNRPLPTGLVPPGGIPGLDAYLRPDVYGEAANPAVINAQSSDMMNTLQDVPGRTWDGGMAQYFRDQQQAATQTDLPATNIDAQSAPGNPDAPNSETTDADAYGIIATPTAP